MRGPRARQPGSAEKRGADPRFRRMEAIAGALSQRVQDLLFAPGLLE